MEIEMDDIKTWADKKSSEIVSYFYRNSLGDIDLTLMIQQLAKEAFAKGQESEKQRIKGICDKIQNSLVDVDGTTDSYSIGHLWALEKVKDALGESNGRRT